MSAAGSPEPMASFSCLLRRPAGCLTARPCVCGLGCQCLCCCCAHGDQIRSDHFPLGRGVVGFGCRASVCLLVHLNGAARHGPRARAGHTAARGRERDGRGGSIWQTGRSEQGAYAGFFRESRNKLGPARTTDFRICAIHPSWKFFIGSIFFTISKRYTTTVLFFFSKPYYCRWFKMGGQVLHCTYR